MHGLLSKGSNNSENLTGRETKGREQREIKYIGNTGRKLAFSRFQSYSQVAHNKPLQSI